MKMKMGLTLGLCALVMTLTAGGAAAANPADGTITVTPTSTLSITVGGAIALGAVDVGVGQSTYSVVGQLLTNLSTVGVLVKSKIGTASGWTASTAAGLDTYVLKNLAAAAVPTSAALDAEAALSGSDATLTGAQTMGATGQASDHTSIWYKLQMPTSVSSAAAKTITITYTATAL